MILKCLCGSNEYTVVGSKEGGEVVCCSDCQLWYVREVDDLYEKQYIGPWYQNQRQVDVDHAPYKDRYWSDYGIAIHRMDEIMKYKKSGHILDVGCANGAFVHHAYHRGFRAMGIDMADATGEIEHCYVGSLINHTLGDKYDYKDVITMYDVIEHFNDPVDQLELAWDILKNGGLLVIEAPDFEHSTTFRQLGINWKHVRPVEHIYMIPTGRVERMLTEIGFRVDKILFPIPDHYAMYAIKEAE